MYVSLRTRPCTKWSILIIHLCNLLFGSFAKFERRQYLGMILLLRKLYIQFRNQNSWGKNTRKDFLQWSVGDLLEDMITVPTKHILFLVVAQFS